MRLRGRKQTRAKRAHLRTYFSIDLVRLVLVVLHPPRAASSSSVPLEFGAASAWLEFVARVCWQKLARSRRRRRLFV